MAKSVAETAEGKRLAEIREGTLWRLWGPYVSDRHWGTVREDYSATGEAWDYFPHDHARSRAYRWGEDGIAGWGERHLYWCLTLALWNGNDPILKERLFGLTNEEGNHGEDVKELYYHLDGELPVRAQLHRGCCTNMPQAAFPYHRLVEKKTAAPHYKADPGSSRSSTPESSKTTAISTSRSNTRRPASTTC